MSWLHIWHRVPVNKSSRPILLESEHTLAVKEGVGLYQGKLKIKNHQNGRVYLTSQRLIYIDHELNHAIGVYLLAVCGAQFVERFLRLSPKIKVFLKKSYPEGQDNTGHDKTRPATSPDTQNGHDEDKETAATTRPALHFDPGPTELADWTCMICSFNNSMPLATDPAQGASCVSCGVPAPQDQLEEALHRARSASDRTQLLSRANGDLCPKCTFINHPSMRYCELCGAALQVLARLRGQIAKLEPAEPRFDENPLKLVLEEPEAYTADTPYIKLSFRKGADPAFLEQLQEQIATVQWLQMEAQGKVNGDATRLLPSPSETGPAPRRHVVRGIQGLEQHNEMTRSENARVLQLLLADLDVLMHRAQDLLVLSSSFRPILARPASKRGTVMSPMPLDRASKIYHQELARHVSEFLLTNELTRVTSMVTTQDLFASYNRFCAASQGFGLSLVAAADFAKCLRFFDEMDLPVTLKTFLSGLVVVVQRAQELKDIHKVITQYLVAEQNEFMLQKFRFELLVDTDAYTRRTYDHFPGRTVAEVAAHFAWSLAVCQEELDACIEKGLAVFDRHVLGTFYFVNVFDEELSLALDDETELKRQAEQSVLAQQSQISLHLKSRYEESENLVQLNAYDFGMDQPIPAEESTPVSPSPKEPENTLLLLDGLKF